MRLCPSAHGQGIQLLEEHRSHLFHERKWHSMRAKGAVSGCRLETLLFSSQLHLLDTALREIETEGSWAESSSLSFKATADSVKSRVLIKAIRRD